MLPLRAFPKVQAILEPQQLSRTLVGGRGSYPSVEKQSVYSTALADWANVESVPEIKITKTFYLTLLKILSKFIDVSNQNPPPTFYQWFLFISDGRFYEIILLYRTTIFFITNTLKLNLSR